MKPWPLWIRVLYRLSECWPKTVAPIAARLLLWRSEALLQRRERQDPGGNPWAEFEREKLAAMHRRLDALRDRKRGLT